MKSFINKFLLILGLTVALCACFPKVDLESLDKQQVAEDIGHIKVDEALKKYPKLQKADSSFITYAGKRINMPNSYIFLLTGGGMAIFQFDSKTDVLQNVLLIGLTQSFESARDEIKKYFPSYSQYTEAEFEANYGHADTPYEDHHKIIEKLKDRTALFKQGLVLITVGKDEQNEKNIVIFYQNSDYLPVLKQKAELPSRIIQALQTQQIIEGIGNIKVEEVLKKFPEVTKESSSFITYGEKKITMPNSYVLSLADGGLLIFQFDEKTNILQNVLLIGLKQSFESAQEELKKYYSIYPQYTAAEFAATRISETTFENHQQFLEERKDEMTLFKQGSVLITLGKSIKNDGTIIVFYQNSDYLAVLKEKAALIK